VDSLRISLFFSQATGAGSALLGVGHHLAALLGPGVEVVDQRRAGQESAGAAGQPRHWSGPRHSAGGAGCSRLERPGATQRDIGESRGCVGSGLRTPTFVEIMQPIPRRVDVGVVDGDAAKIAVVC
jgi:hypothetical protein